MNQTARKWHTYFPVPELPPALHKLARRRRVLMLRQNLNFTVTKYVQCVYIHRCNNATADQENCLNISTRRRRADLHKAGGNYNNLDTT